MKLWRSSNGSPTRTALSRQLFARRVHGGIGFLRPSLLLALIVFSLSLAAQGDFTVSPVNGSFTAVGGTLTVTVNAPAGTAWTATSNAEWLTVSPGAGTGPGSVTLTSSPNSATSFREAQVSIGPVTVFLFQEPLSAVVRFLPDSVSVSGTGAVRSIQVLVEPQNLPWQAQSNADWIGILTPPDVGSGNLTFAVATNRSIVPRTGTINVLGTLLTVTQSAGSPASFSFSPGSASLPYEGGSGVINVTANPESASWFASPFVPWITVNQTQFTGSGSVQYSVAQNPAMEPRQGVISIGGNTFVVSQAANPNPPEPPPVSATFQLSTGLVSFSAPTGSTTEVTQSLGISSTGDPLNFTVEVEGAAWLRARSAGGTTPTNILFTADPTSLPQGTYLGTIRIRSTTNNAVVEVPARLRITPPPGTPPRPATSPSSLYFSRIVGEAVPGAVEIKVGRPGELVPVSLSVPPSATWLQAGATTGLQGTVITAGIRNLNFLPGLYRADITVSSPTAQFQPFTIPVAYRVQMSPMGKPYISSGGIVSAASFEQGIASNTWISIFGSNLANSTRSWGGSDFQGGRLPTNLDGVEVTVNGAKAAISFISPTQLNILPPASNILGEVEIIVSKDGDVSEAAVGFLTETLPAFFTFSPMNGKYVAALHLNADPVGPVGLITTGRNSRPAKPGDVIQVFGTGFGPTNPPVDPSRLFQGAAPLVDPDLLQITVGGLPAVVGFAGLSGTGLNQFNVTVPVLPAGDHEIVARIGDVFTKTGIFVRVEP